MSAGLWERRVTIGGSIVPNVFSTSSVFGTRQAASTSTIRLPREMTIGMSDGDSVVVEWREDGAAWWPVFTGTLQTIDPSLSAQGRTATLGCVGPNGRGMSLEFGKDKAFTGGARVAPTTLTSTTRHLGSLSISYYDHPAPHGAEVDFTFTPLVDSSFVWFVCDLHGTNSYANSTGKKKTTSWSRIEVWQNGKKLGFAHFPENSERWWESGDPGSPTDFTDRDNWQTGVELFVTADIKLIDGTVTVKVIAGYEPGTTTRDEFEIDNLTYQTSGKSTLREIGRGLKKRAGLATSQYDIPNVTDLDGNIIRLGGNGLVDAGQVVMDARDVPITWYNRILDLFGAADFDCPDGVTRSRAVRGKPTGTAKATFVEGTETMLGAAHGGVDPNQVSNVVEIDGASGSDEDGEDFAYAYRTADVDIIPSPHIPGDERLHSGSSTLLVSNTLCQQAGEIAEVNFAEPRAFSWDSRPVSLRPGNIVRLTSDTLDWDDLVWLTKLTYDDGNGFKMSCEGWTGVSHPFDEEEDPNPSETDTEPTDKRPANEWRVYRPKAGIAA